MQPRASVVDGGEGEWQKRGVKRHADESRLNDEQRFTKRFNLLSIGPEPRRNSNYYEYIPVSSTAPSSSQDAYMQLDDTSDRVYIHNLEAELAEIEASEDPQQLVFLPDIEKRLSKIPQQVLKDCRGSLDDHENQELVLYSVPKSLTVEEGHDSVRKAIVEARQRARERAVEAARLEDMVMKYDQSGHGDGEQAETAHGYSAGPEETVDPDAMEIE